MVGRLLLLLAEDVDVPAGLVCATVSGILSSGDRLGGNVLAV